MEVAALLAGAKKYVLYALSQHMSRMLLAGHDLQPCCCAVTVALLACKHVLACTSTAAKWTAIEVHSLTAAYALHPCRYDRGKGKGKWRQVYRDKDFGPPLAARSLSDLSVRHACSSLLAL